MAGTENRIRVRMVPGPKTVSGEGGVSTVIRKYGEHLPAYGIDLVEENYDLIASHAGMYSPDPSDGTPFVAHLHGIYFTGPLRFASVGVSGQRQDSPGSQTGRHYDCAKSLDSGSYPARHAFQSCCSATWG
jgi:hypothetical protein